MSDVFVSHYYVICSSGYISHKHQGNSPKTIFEEVGHLQRQTRQVNSWKGQEDPDVRSEKCNSDMIQHCIIFYLGLAKLDSQYMCTKYEFESGTIA